MGTRQLISAARSRLSIEFVPKLTGMLLDVNVASSGAICLSGHNVKQPPRRTLFSRAQRDRVRALAVLHNVYMYVI